MRKASVKKIEKAVADLCVKCAVDLRSDVEASLKAALKKEKTKKAKHVLSLIVENARLARKDKLPICQDTGMAVVYLDVGQEARLTDGALEAAVHRGVARGYRSGKLRKSVVEDPHLRKNTGTNVPAVIHTRIVPGAKVKISVMMKGFGCENKSRIVMLNPTAGPERVREEAVRIIREAGPDACPPFVVGVGLGGTADKAAELAKRAQFGKIGERNKKEHLAKLEKEIIRSANGLNVGPLGFGGKTTVLDVKIREFPTHVAGLPLAVNIGCHALRTKEAVI